MQIICPKCGKEIHLGDDVEHAWFVPYPEPCVYDAFTDRVVSHLPCGWFIARRAYWVECSTSERGDGLMQPQTELELLRRIAAKAEEVYKQWNTWRGSEAWAMAELAELLAEWRGFGEAQG